MYPAQVESCVSHFNIKGYYNFSFENGEIKRIVVI